MPTRNRGKQPNDDICFATKWHPIFTEAVDDLCFLLSRGYAVNSGLQLVGNHYKLNKRQRNAIQRISSSDQEILTRNQAKCTANQLVGKRVEIDGLNLLILLENALSGAYIFKARDGTYRDISSVHGSYKRVVKTENAILLVGDTLKEMGVESVKWYLDQPVSNSGRLKTKLLEISRECHYNWDAELVYNPDAELAKSDHVVISSDGWILDHAKVWFNLGAHLIENTLQNANVVVV